MRLWCCLIFSDLFLPCMTPGNDVLVANYFYSRIVLYFFEKCAWAPTINFSCIYVNIDIQRRLLIGLHNTDKINLIFTHFLTAYDITYFSMCLDLRHIVPYKHHFLLFLWKYLDNSEIRLFHLHQNIYNNFSQLY